MDSKQSSIVIGWPFELDQVEKWAYWKDAFTPAECQKIIDIGNQYSLEDGTAGGAVDSEVRESKIAFLPVTPETNWIFERIANIANKLNDKFFKFDLYGIMEGLQFTKYEAPGGHYKFHVDNGHQDLVRKLSIVIQLSDPDSYTGGDLEVNFGEPRALYRDHGCLNTFPSYVLHRVSPITEGTRYSLVAWVTGKSFK